MTDYMRQFAFIGTPKQIAEHISDNILGHGIDGIVINLPVNGHEPGVVTEMGRVLSPIL
ncbi:hypothetical protein EV643_103406 [Kribbella sp. VKM Ac-2527]|uniref:Luciferase-like monooxygenase n=1 Tax=Kribbella caucasensis TaxID=2512215 RepID=A0A4R6KK16_9ACTN|nr:hypothetical protein [Kribbella sp. VKM Ac-2527]TDO51667.1 hypothetical protein EV643_103406 [Kribbella sp. VKM Ac-2527]